LTLENDLCCGPPQEKMIVVSGRRKTEISGVNVLGTLFAEPVVFARLTAVVPIRPVEYQMSKRKPATVTKRANSPKRAAQRANQAIVRSPKDNRLPSVAAGSTESPPERHDDSIQEAPLVEHSAIALQEQMKAVDSKHGFGFLPSTANLVAYQGKLLELTQDNMQFAFEFAAKLAAIRSPVEIFTVIVEFTSKRIAMFQKFSIEMAELGTKG